MSESLISVSGDTSRLKVRTNARNTSGSVRIAGARPSRSTERMNDRGSFGSSRSSPASIAAAMRRASPSCGDRRAVPGQQVLLGEGMQLERLRDEVVGMGAHDTGEQIGVPEARSSSHGRRAGWCTCARRRRRGHPSTSGRPSTHERALAVEEPAHHVHLGDRLGDDRRVDPGRRRRQRPPQSPRTTRRSTSARPQLAVVGRRAKRDRERAVVALEDAYFR